MGQSNEATAQTKRQSIRKHTSLRVSYTLCWIICAIVCTGTANREFTANHEIVEGFASPESQQTRKSRGQDPEIGNCVGKNQRILAQICTRSPDQAATATPQMPGVQQVSSSRVSCPAPRAPRVDHQCNEHSGFSHASAAVHWRCWNTTTHADPSGYASVTSSWFWNPKLYNPQHAYGGRSRSHRSGFDTEPASDRQATSVTHPCAHIPCSRAAAATEYRNSIRTTRASEDADQGIATGPVGMATTTPYAVELRVATAFDSGLNSRRAVSESVVQSTRVACCTNHTIGSSRYASSRASPTSCQCSRCRNARNGQNPLTRGSSRFCNNVRSTFRNFCTATDAMSCRNATVSCTNQATTICSPSHEGTTGTTSCLRTCTTSSKCQCFCEQFPSSYVDQRQCIASVPASSESQWSQWCQFDPKIKAATAKLWDCNTSSRIGTHKSGSHTCTNSKSRRRQTLQPCHFAVGLAGCFGEDRPQSPSAVSSQGYGPTCNRNNRVQICLDASIPPDPFQVSMSQAVDSICDLCKFWPCDSMFWDLGFLDLLPDLNPEQRQLLHNTPTWTGDHVDAVHIYVDGSSFGLNRSDPATHEAGWAFIVLVQCNHAFQFYGATSHILDKGNMYTNKCNSVGELLSDALSAEATGMIWVLAWTLQNPFHAPCWIHYDNCTVGQYAAGVHQWKATWEYQSLHRNIAALRHCLIMLHRLPFFQHQKSHDGHPWSDAVDALAKSVTKRIVVPHPLPQVVCAALNNPRFKFAWMHLLPSGQAPCPSTLRAVFQSEGPLLHAPPEDVTWCPARVQPCHLLCIHERLDTVTRSQEGTDTRVNAERPHCHLATSVPST